MLSHRMAGIAASIAASLFLALPGVAEELAAIPASASGSRQECRHSSIPWPPLECYIPSISEDGERSLVTVYHENGTFDYTVSSVQMWGRNPMYSTYDPDRIGAPRLTGHWWREDVANGVFGMSMDTGKDAGRPQYKKGRLMGKVTLYGEQIR